MAAAVRLIKNAVSLNYSCKGNREHNWMFLEAYDDFLTSADALPTIDLQAPVAGAAAATLVGSTALCRCGELASS